MAKTKVEQQTVSNVGEKKINKSIHTVQKGEQLHEIATKYKLSLATLKSMNRKLFLGKTKKEVMKDIVGKELIIKE